MAWEFISDKINWVNGVYLYLVTYVSIAIGIAGIELATKVIMGILIGLPLALYNWIKLWRFYKNKKEK